MAAPLGFYARVAREYARIGLVRKSQFRWEFVNQVVMDCLYYLSFLLTFDFLFGLQDGATLAGWTRADVRVFLGMAFVTDAFSMTWLGQTWHFGDDLKAGNLDPFRMRPGPVWFTYTFQRFSLEGLTNGLVAAAILAHGLAVHPGVGWGEVALLPVALGVAFVGQVGLVIGFQALEYWVVNGDLARFCNGVFTQIADRPLDVYPRGMKRVFVWLVPLGALAWFPAGLVVGRHGLGFTALNGLVVTAFTLAAAALFRRGMRRYESAMG